MTAIATPKSVFDAADELHGAGQTPTIDAIIARIGGGSKSTVGPLLEAWRLKEKADIEPMPDSLEARLRALANVIWSEAMSKLEPRIVAAKKEFHIELQVRDRAVENYLGNIQALEDRISRLEAELEAERMRRAHLLVSLQKVTAANNEVEQHIANLETAHAENSQHKLTIAKFEAENTLLREQFALLAPRRKARSIASTASPTALASSVQQGRSMRAPPPSKP